MALFAASLVALLGFAALAVDVGMLYTAQTQARRAADAGAHGGAAALLVAPHDSAGARDEAERIAEFHTILGDSVQVDAASDIEIEGDTLVRVFVHRTAARGNSLATYFAQVLGVVEADLSVHAAAVVARGARIEGDCLFPFIPPDPWRESDGTRSAEVPFVDFDDAPTFDPGAGDTYQAPNETGDVWDAFTGWGAKPWDVSSGGDVGRYFVANLGELGSNTPSSGWWYHMNVPPSDGQGGGVSDMRDAIAGNCPSYDIREGMDVFVQTGKAPTPLGVEIADQLAASNGPSSAEDAKSCYQDGTHCGSGAGAGKRIRTMAFYDPNFPPGPGSSAQLKAGNFGRVWLAGFCRVPKGKKFSGVVQPDFSGHPLCSGLSNKVAEDTFVVMYLGPVPAIAADDGEAGSSGVKAIRIVE